MKIIYLFVSAVLLLPASASAHCPLCTVGAGALAVIASSLGVSAAVVGLMIGAFAIALSLWIASLIKKQYIRYQRPIIIILIYLTTVGPIYPMVRAYKPLYLSVVGEYGATYMIDLYLVGALLGTAIVLVAPYVSAWMKRNWKLVPYQGLIITFSLLIITAILLQIIW